MATEEDSLVSDNAPTINTYDGTAPRRKPIIDIGWHIGDHDLTTWDRSEQFIEILKSFCADKKLHADSRILNYHFIFIPGMGSDHLPYYFTSAMHHLRERYPIGITFMRPTSEAGLEKNTRFLKFQLKKLHNSVPDKKFIFVTHSKGGTDLVATLCKYPRLQKWVKTVIACQSPFGGAPLAEFALYGKRKSFVKWLYRSFLHKGDYDCLLDLTYEGRKQYFQRYPLNLLDVPVICLSSKVTNSNNGVFGIMNRFVRGGKYKDHGDGLVPIHDALLPGAVHAVLPKGNHSAPFWNWKLVTKCKYESSKIVEALIQWTFALDDAGELKSVVQNLDSRITSNVNIIDANTNSTPSSHNNEELPPRRAKSKKPKDVSTTPDPSSLASSDSSESV